MESKVETVGPSVNVLWQNLIALNTSLFKENEEKNQQLIEMKKKLQTEEEVSRKLRSKVEVYQKDLMQKNQRIDQLTSNLKAVRQLTEGLGLNDDFIEMKPLVENRSAKSTPIRNNENDVSSQRKISHFFPNGCIDTETKPSVKEISDSNIKRTKSVVDENLLTPLHNQEIRDEILISPLSEKTQNLKKTNICKVCGRHFFHLQALQRHELLHTGRTPYTCIRCSRSFVRPDHFKNHMRAHRTKQLTVKSLNEPFKCDICVSTFTLKGNLIRHKKNVHQK